MSAVRQPLAHRELARFLGPMVFTMIAHALAPQFINGGLARAPRPTQTLAAFALAWGLIDFLQAPMSQVRQLTLVLGTNSLAAARRVLGFVLLCSGALAAAVALLACSRAGLYLIEDLHGASASLAQLVRVALVALIPVPILEGVLRYLSGLLMRVRRTDVISVATLAGIGTSILTVFAALPRLRKIDAGGDDGLPGWGYLLRFFWPLAQIPYGWINEARSLPATWPTQAVFINRNHVYRIDTDRFNGVLLAWLIFIPLDWPGCRSLAKPWTSLTWYSVPVSGDGASCSVSIPMLIARHLPMRGVCCCCAMPPWTTRSLVVSPCTPWAFASARRR